MLLSELTAAVREAGVPLFAFVSIEPLANLHTQMGTRLSGESEAMMRIADFVDVSPGYFDVLRLPIIAGRDFDDRDRGRPVAIVNETFARQYWPGEKPIGRSFIGGGRDSLEIVGLVKDAHTTRLNAVEPVFYRPIGDHIRGELFPRLLFRSTQASTWTAVSAIVSNVEPRARVDVVPLRDRFADWLSELKVAPMAASILGALGLLLATIGMSGVFAYVVRQRTKEIGIRMALGARPAAISRLVLAGNSRAVIAGLVVGLGGALGASQVLRGSLYGLSPLDPIAYGGVVLLLAAAALTASYLPARRATRVDPVLALRHE